MAEVTPRWRAPLRAPLTVCLWLTDSCNLACAYCYAMPFSGRRMDTKRVLELVSECADLGVFDLTVAGGEPLLHPDVDEVVALATQRGVRVGLLTNGILLNQARVEEFAERCPPKRLLVQVSLDSADDEVNCVTRGHTARVMQGIRRAAAAGLEVQIACVVNRANVTTAHRLIDTFYPSVKRFHFLNIQRTSRSLSRPELLLDEDEAGAFWLRLNEHRKRFPADLFLPSLRLHFRASGLTHLAPEFALQDTATFDCSSCSAGWTHVNIDADFNVLGCDIAKDFTRLGNVRTRPLADVWHSEEATRVRAARYPSCYRIRGEDGTALEDHLKPEYALGG